MNPDEVGDVVAALRDSAERILDRGATDATAEDGVDDAPVVAPAVMFARIVDSAVRTVPGAELAGITVGGEDGILGHVPGDPRAAELERVQGAGDGPCADALRDRRTTTVVVDDLAVDTARWPLFTGTAARLGVRSVLAFVVAPPGVAPLAVCLYSSRPAAFTESSRAIGAAFAMQAAVAVYGARQTGILLAELESRDVIGRATGILMERFGLDDRQAFAMLVSSAQDTDRPLLDIATWLTTQGKPVPVR